MTEEVSVQLVSCYDGQMTIRDRRTGDRGEGGGGGGGGEGGVTGDGRGGQKVNVQLVSCYSC